MIRSEEEEGASCLLPSPRQCSVGPARLQSKGGRCRVRTGETLLPPEGPSHQLGIYPGCRHAPRRPGAGCAGPGACWSEHQPEAGPPGQTALKSRGTKKNNSIYTHTVSHYWLSAGTTGMINDKLQG